MTPLPIKVISEEEAEKAEMAVCCRVGEPSIFVDNVFGTCSECGHAIFFRPTMPKRPRKICTECLIDRLKGGHA